MPSKLILLPTDEISLRGRQGDRSKEMLSTTSSTGPPLPQRVDTSTPFSSLSPLSPLSPHTTDGTISYESTVTNVGLHSIQSCTPNEPRRSNGSFGSFGVRSSPSSFTTITSPGSTIAKTHTKRRPATITSSSAPRKPSAWEKYHQTLSKTRPG